MSQIISPFIRYCMALGVVPSNYEDNLTVIECLNFLIKFLNDTVIPAFNENDEHVEEIKKQIEALQKYVDSYFDSLDIQTEVDHKLDQMASSGQLADIIAQYLGLAGVLAYNTIANMAAAKNLVNGSICRVLGNTNYATGDGAFYRVRTLVNTDVVDGVNLVAITAAPTLVAERIPDNITNKKYIFVGDSYDDGYNPDGNVEGWGSRLATILGLKTGDYINTHRGGMGFSRSSEYNYYTLINALSNDKDVTDILIAGSYNDQSASETAILEGITAVKNLCATKFPNAKLHIAFIGWSSNASAKTELIQCYKYYKNACDSFLDIDFMENTQYILHEYFTDFASDGVHPTDAGQAKIAKYLAQCLTDGKCNIAFNGDLYLTPVSSGSLSGAWTAGTQIINDTTTLFFNGSGVISWNSGNYVTISGKSITKLADITSGVMIGNSVGNCCASCMCVTQTSDGKYHSLPCQLIIKEKGLYIQPCLINSTGSNYDTQALRLIQMGYLNITINSMYA